MKRERVRERAKEKAKARGKVVRKRRRKTRVKSLQFSDSRVVRGLMKKMMITLNTTPKLMNLMRVIATRSVRVVITITVVAEMAVRAAVVAIALALKVITNTKDITLLSLSDRTTLSALHLITSVLRS